MMYNKPELSREAVDYVFSHHPNIFRDMCKASFICDMKLGGVSYKEIGIEVGLSAPRVREYVDKVCRLYGVYLRRLSREKKKRLFDKIKEMSVTELAEFLEKNNAKFVRNADAYICKRCKNEHGKKCPYAGEQCIYETWSDADLIREWLLQEVQE